MGGGENWANGNFGKLNQQKICISGFLSINGNGISESAIMKKLKNVRLFVNINCTENVQTTDLSKFGSRFSVCQQKWNTSIRHYEKNWKMAAISLILIIRKNFKLLTPPKFWVSSFLSVNGNEISASAIMKKLKKDCYFININFMENFQITDPAKVWVCSFICVNENGISVSVIMKKIEKWLPYHKYWSYGSYTNKVWVSSFLSMEMELWKTWKIS